MITKKINSQFKSYLFIYLFEIKKYPFFITIKNKIRVTFIRLN
jgi:hypothetical protein